MKTMLAASLLLAAAGQAAATTHPFSVHDMLAMDRISDPRVSPDGTRVVFTVRVTFCRSSSREDVPTMISKSPASTPYFLSAL